jgi:endonuclease/exonuclease/phosphatase family metal-dependent hydrolase
MQEVGPEMYQDLQAQLPLYGSSYGREKSSSFGCATFFLHETFRLSNEPLDVLGQNKQHKKPRVVAHLTELLLIGTEVSMVVCNVHLLYGFDVYMDTKRTEMIQQLHTILQMDEYKILPQIICGDFNSKVSVRLTIFKTFNYIFNFIFSQALSIPLAEVVESGKFFDVYHDVVSRHPEMTVESFHHGEPIAVDYVFATPHFTVGSVLNMPSIRSMRSTQLPIPGFEASDHFYHLVNLTLPVGNLTT